MATDAGVSKRRKKRWEAWAWRREDTNDQTGRTDMRLEQGGRRRCARSASVAGPVSRGNGTYTDEQYNWKAAARATLRPGQCELQAEGRQNAKEDDGGGRSRQQAKRVDGKSAGRQRTNTTRLVHSKSGAIAVSTPHAHARACTKADTVAGTANESRRASRYSHGMHATKVCAIARNKNGPSPRPRRGKRMYAAGARAKGHKQQKEKDSQKRYTGASDSKLAAEHGCDEKERERERGAG
ncbi:hypothetical protein THASP1DRAFT_22238 [Thamnocephalis sphaerospora]|uniref:Uncharacterized protein n=1 Tax=Thamnocephalis sphaerospora TaxID=78915 RepID=A0A4P9XX02_9FUNG|nr:hypothetical protein THASP1DRAFT_22238 [Thamnocephalis sphaerospora]|eukprot:RKP09970.1 hypothetical protein THASP1DRAFT_22238 [Thamnocephalis sphaerospora]